MNPRTGDSLAPPTGRPAELLGVLRDCPDFRRLYFARTASLLGDWFNLIAVLALIRVVGGSGAESIGLLLILKLLPAAVVGPLAGVVADRFPRRRIMITADAARFVTVLALFAAPQLPPPLGRVTVYAVTALQVAGQSFSEPARLASVPNVVPAARLGAANVLGAMTWSLMFTLGAGAGGLVTTFLGWRAAIAIDATTYLVSIALVSRVRLPPPPRHEGSVDLLTLLGIRDLGAAARYLRERPGVAALLTGKSGWGLAGGITLVLTLYGEQVYAIDGRPSLGIAALYVARGVGTGIGPLLARRWTRERTEALRHAIALGFFVAAGAYLAFASVRSLPLAASLVVVAHLGGSTVWVFTTLLLQRQVPDLYRGRVFAFDMALATATISAATWIYGRILDRELLALSALPRLAAATLVVTGAIWWLATRRRETAKTPPDPL
ncbi:MAG: MFS transporter [Acidobacteriota bacterium]|nr:MFS transporter [Acidobacteriota bacterium]